VIIAWMRLTVSDSAAIPELLAALRRGQCVADRGEHASVEVAFPWATTLWEAQQAIVELAFFARAWEAAHPGVSIHLEELG
jgi:hypothetical protein